MGEPANDIQQAMTSVSGLEAAKFWGHNFFDTAEQGVMERVKAGNHQMVKYVPPPKSSSDGRKWRGSLSGKTGLRRWKAKVAPTPKRSWTKLSDC